MHRGATGTLEIDRSSGEEVRAFVPFPLPPDPPIEWTPGRQLRLERAVLACGRLDGVATLLPDAGLFLYSYIRQEAVLSSQIEGTQSSLADLLLHELEVPPGTPIDDVAEVSRYVSALELGIRRLDGGPDGLPLSGRLLRELHARLLGTGRGATKLPGEFRRTQNWIGGTRPGNAAFVPPPPHRIAECLADLERTLHDPSLPALIKAATTHVQFETIHPFLDGNGRTGRLLIALVLHAEGVLRQPLLYLSLYLKRHRSEYYRLLDLVRREGDWEAWIDFFLEGVAETASAAVATAHRILALLREDDARLLSTARSPGSTRTILAQLGRRPISDLRSLAAATGLSFPTAAAAVDRLVALGIVREITGRRRGRVFAYDRFLALLAEGTEA